MINNILNKIFKQSKIYYLHLINKLIKHLFHLLIMKKIICGGKKGIGLRLKNQSLSIMFKLAQIRHFLWNKLTALHLKYIQNKIKIKYLAK